MLVPLSDLQSLTQDAQRVSDHWLIDGSPWGFPRALLKLNGHGANEASGYQLAMRIRAPVPRFVRVWLDSPQQLGEAEFGFGTVGLLVEWLEDWKPIGRWEAAALDARGFSRALALCAFDRLEWGEFGRSDGQLRFIDLERLFPGVNVALLTAAEPRDRSAYLRAALASYLAGIPTEIDETIEQAIQYGVIKEFKEAVSELAGLSSPGWKDVFELTPHPFAEELADTLRTGALARLDSLVERLASASPCA